MDIKVGKKAIAEATEKLKNWGRWGKDDQIGTLNHVTPEDIVKAASLIRTGKVFALGIPLDATGPKTGLFGGRFNPIHQMLATGTDAIAGRQDWNKIRYADDTLMLCVQGATHWDALGHIFYEDKCYNGHDAKLIDSRGLSVLGIERDAEREHLAGADQARGFDDVLGRYMIERADLVILAPAPPVLELFGRFGDRLLADFDIHALAHCD